MDWATRYTCGTRPNFVVVALWAMKSDRRVTKPAGDETGMASLSSISLRKAYRREG
jgi:hypothetical protein